MPFVFEPAGLEGAVLVKPRLFTDGRGAFMETYKSSDFAAAGLPAVFVQDNQSVSSKGVLRGLHFQRGAAAQGKLVRCQTGAIRDVGVDLRAGSPTRGRWIAAELTDVNGHMLYLPPGFAHGFVALSATAVVSYKCTAEYSAKDDAGLRWDDPELAVDWGISSPLLSEKDAALPYLRDAAL